MAEEQRRDRAVLVDELFAKTGSQRALIKKHQHAGHDDRDGDDRRDFRGIVVVQR